jgi:hypothetical protein
MSFFTMILEMAAMPIVILPPNWVLLIDACYYLLYPSLVESTLKRKYVSLQRGFAYHRLLKLPTYHYYDLQSKLSLYNTLLLKSFYYLRYRLYHATRFLKVTTISQETYAYFYRHYFIRTMSTKRNEVSYEKINLQRGV